MPAKFDRILRREQAPALQMRIVFIWYITVNGYVPNDVPTMYKNRTNRRGVHCAPAENLIKALRNDTEVYRLKKTAPACTVNGCRRGLF